MVEPTQKFFAAEIVGDPAVGLPPRGKLTFEQWRPPFMPDCRAAVIDDWEAMNGIVLGVTFTDDTTYHSDGSAVLVAPGIALCAAHTFDDHMVDLAAGTQSVQCFGVTKSGLRVWSAQTVTLVPHTDLAILGLKLVSKIDSGTVIHQACISTRLPAIDERITIFGFQTTNHNGFDFNEVSMALSSHLFVCGGSVMQQLIGGRGRMKPWPTLEVDCPSWGSMSGGPAFDAWGNLIGVTSSSFDDGPSYISMIFPALTLPIPSGWPTKIFPNRKTSLLELDARFCFIDKRDAVTDTREARGWRLPTYTPWN